MCLQKPPTHILLLALQLQYSSPPWASSNTLAPNHECMPASASSRESSSREVQLTGRFFGVVYHSINTHDFFLDIYNIVQEQKFSPIADVLAKWTPWHGVYTKCVQACGTQSQTVAKKITPHFQTPVPPQFLHFGQCVPGKRPFLPFQGRLVS